MQMLYNSEQFAVVRFDMPAQGSDGASPRGGYEIVDKFARKEIYLQGAVADSFQRGVEALAQQNPDESSVDEFIAGFTALAQHPVVLH